MGWKQIFLTRSCMSLLVLIHLHSRIRVRIFFRADVVGWLQEEPFHAGMRLADTRHSYSIFVHDTISLLSNQIPPNLKKSVEIICEDVPQNRLRQKLFFRLTNEKKIFTAGISSQNLRSPYHKFYLYSSIVQYCINYQP